MGLAKKNAFVKKKGRAIFSKAKEFKAKANSKQKPTKGGKGKKMMQKAKKPREEVPISYKHYAIKMTGLPFDVTDKELRQWFKGSGAPLNELRRCDSDNWKTGMAYATVLSDEALKKAVQQDNKDLKGRYIRVVLKLKVEMKSVLQAASVVDCFAVLKGLPFDCTKPEIAQFFEGLSIVDNGICFQKKGIAFVRFVDPATAKEALKKNKDYIRERYVHVHFCKLQQLTELKWELTRSGQAGKTVLSGLMKNSPNQGSQPKSKTSEPSAKQTKKKTKKKEPQPQAEIEEDTWEDGSIHDDDIDEDQLSSGDDQLSSDEDLLSGGEEDSDDESMEEAEQNLEATAAATTKKNKGAKGSIDRSSYLAAKGFAVAKSNGSFMDIVKKDSSAKKSRGKRTSMVGRKSAGKTVDSDDEMMPQLVQLAPKQKMNMSLPSKKSRSTPMKKKVKRRSMFTETPK